MEKYKNVAVLIQSEKELKSFQAEYKSCIGNHWDGRDLVIYFDSDGKLDGWDRMATRSRIHLKIVPYSNAPKSGDTVLVRNKKDWTERTYLATLPNGLILCTDKTLLDCNHAVNCYAWLEMKPMPQTKTITIDGKDLDISIESFNSLKAFFKKLG